jgi:ETFB lysine methyltransferase
VKESLTADLAALEDDLRRRFRTVERTFEIRGRALTLLHPASAEDLINEEDFERDERLPYWADVWPSARVLGAIVVTMPGAGQSFLELGCGAGLVAACAALAGFAVTATDYYADALGFTRVNVWRNAGVDPAVRIADWRTFPEDLTGFDVVAAADVLYERPYGPLVARAMAQAAKQGGLALLADPGRVGRDAFAQECGRRGLRGDVTEVAFAEPPVEQRIAVSVLRAS